MEIDEGVHFLFFDIIIVSPVTGVSGGRRIKEKWRMGSNQKVRYSGAGRERKLPPALVEKSGGRRIMLIKGPKIKITWHWQGRETHSIP